MKAKKRKENMNFKMKFYTMDKEFKSLVTNLKYQPYIIRQKYKLKDQPKTL